MEVFSRFGGAYDDPKLLRYINLVGQAVADVSNRPDIEYHFAILNTESPNAFATPGGYVFVSIGLLRMVENEAQLAGVLAHEVAHISQKHALQTLGRSRSLQGLSALTLTVMDKNPGLFDKLIDEVSNVLFTKGLDKNLEFEADRYGREFAYRMGYFLGDGTGAGKGRQVASVILDRWVRGERRHIWISKNEALLEDARRDWAAIGGLPADIQPLSSWKIDQELPFRDGIVFVTYPTLRSQRQDATRLKQLLDWADTDFDGVIAFDESHEMGGVAGGEGARGAKPGVERLLEILPTRPFAALELGFAIAQPGGALGELRLLLVERAA